LLVVQKPHINKHFTQISGIELIIHNNGGTELTVTKNVCHVSHFPSAVTPAMATKMAGRLTVQERAQIAAGYEVWNSVVAWWRTVKGRNDKIRQ
jgi:hypothetical protein